MDDNFFYDKSALSAELVKKQKLKGTYDSPCMSVCNYSGPNDECQTCGMYKAEKQEWKKGDEIVKASIRLMIAGRRE